MSDCKLITGCDGSLRKVCLGYKILYSPLSHWFPKVCVYVHVCWGGGGEQGRHRISGITEIASLGIATTQQCHAEMLNLTQGPKVAWPSTQSNILLLGGGGAIHTASSTLATLGTAALHYMVLHTYTLNTPRIKTSVLSLLVEWVKTRKPNCTAIL